jgi:transposase-like protein
MESITLIENDVPLIPVTTDELGRIRLSPEHKEALLDAFERSAMSALGFARKHGLTYSTFASWVRKRKDLHGPPRIEEPALDSLVEITPVDPPAAGLVVELACGSRIRLADTGQVPLAAALIKTLSH